MKKADSHADFHTDLDSEGLLGLVRRDDVQAVRRYFDGGVKGRAVTRPEWVHLLAATALENLSLMRLLVTWGAAPTKTDLETLIAKRGAAAIDDIRRLRLAGLSIIDLPEVCTMIETVKTAQPKTIYSADNIPDDWKQTLAAFHQCGLPGAFIAGDALHKAMNGKPAGDIHILVPTGDMRASTALLRQIFKHLPSKDVRTMGGLATASAEVTDQIDGKEKPFKNRRFGNAFCDTGCAFYSNYMTMADLLAAGTVNNVSFIVTFIHHASFKQKKTAPEVHQHRMKELITHFDLGLNQIAYDGRSIHTTDAFQRDAVSKTLTVLKQTESTDTRLQKLQEQYEDWKITRSEVHQIPLEWKKVLKAFQDCGASEAVIAGGALRDTFNARAVKDVDIFLSDRWMNKRMLKKAFNAAGLEVQAQVVAHDIYGAVTGKFKKNGGEKTRLFDKVSTRERRTYGGFRSEEVRKSGAESWTIIAGPEKTEYNVVFVKGDLGKALKSAPRDAMQTMVGVFDIGLCQVAFNGNDVYKSPAYADDAAQKKLTLIVPNLSSEGHLKRIAEKYPDYALCTHGKKLLGLDTPPLPSAKKSVGKAPTAVKSAPSHSGGYGWHGYGSEWSS